MILHHARWVHALAVVIKFILLAVVLKIVLLLGLFLWLKPVRASQRPGGNYA